MSDHGRHSKTEIELRAMASNASRVTGLGRFDVRPLRLRGKFVLLLNAVEISPELTAQAIAIYIDAFTFGVHVGRGGSYT